MQDPTGNITIEGRNLIKEYQMGSNVSRVLDGISIQILEGEFVSIMGQSGSGKSTLLYILGGLDHPTSGAVFLRGKDISKLNDAQKSVMRRRNTGFIFQFYNLIPNLSVEENIMLPILLDGGHVKNSLHALTDILEVVGLSDKRRYTPRELSGGQQQRVAIARALINRPDIIFADEPTGNLDSGTGKEIMALLRKINTESKRTIIMVTHSVEATKFGNRVIHVRDGAVA